MLKISSFESGSSLAAGRSVAIGLLHRQLYYSNPICITKLRIVARSSHNPQKLLIGTLGGASKNNFQHFILA